MKTINLKQIVPKVTFKAWEHFSLSRKLYVGFLSVVALAVTLGLIGITQMGRMDSSLSEVIDYWMPKTRLVGEIRTTSSEYHKSVYEHLFIGTRGQNRVEAEMKSHLENLEKSVQEYRRLAEGPDLELIDRFRGQWAEYLTLAAPAIELSRDNESDEAIGQMPRVNEAYQFLSQTLNQLRSLSYEGAGEASERGDRVRRTSTVELLVALVAAIGLGLVLASTITNAIKSPILAVVDQAKRVAQGDLQVKTLKSTRSDEIGDLTRSFSIMVESMTDMLHQIAGAVREVQSASTEVSASAQETSSSMAEIASTMSTVSAEVSDQAAEVKKSMELLTSLRGTIETVARGSQIQVEGITQGAQEVGRMAETAGGTRRMALEVSTATQHSADVAKSGAVAIRQTLDEMNVIREVAGQSREAIGELGRLSGKIGNIVNVISEIADQTNLLALNASIEAARAGEQGKGFAVVASEVRRLAESSAHAAKEIRTMIALVQEQTAKAVGATSSVTREIEKGSDLASQGAEALSQILTSVEDAARQVSQISEASGRMAQSAHLAAEALNQAVQSARENSAAAGNMAKTSEEVIINIRRAAEISSHTVSAAGEVNRATGDLMGANHEMAKQAQLLAQTADSLASLTARFQVEKRHS